MSPALISPDGRWWWDGTQWRSRLVEGELDLFWFTSTPDWFPRILVTGLIGLIPIVGIINMYGWTLTAVDMVRRRWRELPPAGFQYLERGVAPFVVGLVYGSVALLVFGSLALVALLLGFSDHSRVAIAILIGGLDVLLSIAWWLFMLYLFAAILAGSDRLGIGLALDPRRLWAIARGNSGPTLSVAGIYLLGSLALAAVGVAIGAVVPFGGLIVNLGLPGVFAMMVPSLARITIDAAPPLSMPR
jgi:uncharacterized protein DUF4013